MRQLPEQEQIDLLLSSLSQQIDFAIGRRADENRTIGPGFAVAGTGRKALAAVKGIMDLDQIPSQTFPLGTEVSLFFFTRNSGRTVQLKDVRQSKETVTIRYQFVPHSTSGKALKILNRYFVLIPLGKPAVGNYAVNIIRLPMEKKYRKRNPPVSKERTEQIICKPFSFSIDPPVSEANINE